MTVDYDILRYWRAPHGGFDFHSYFSSVEQY